MKQVICLLAILITVIACNNLPGKKTTEEEVYELTNEALYSSCADLKGVGSFIIGQTTFNEVLSNNDFKRCSNQYGYSNNFIHGNFNSPLWRNPDDAVEKINLVERLYGDVVKQLYMNVGGVMQIGDLEFNPFDMAFLNDTLVAVYFFPSTKSEDVVMKHYKEKYGNGTGYRKHVYWRENAGSKAPIYHNIEEEHLWANEHVALEYKNNEHSVYFPGRGMDRGPRQSLLIYSRKRYPVFESILTELSNSYDEMRDKEKQDVLNSL